MSNSGLGRGLSSLIPPSRSSSAGSAKKININSPGDEKDKIWQVSPEEIKVNPLQPRQTFTDYQMEELIDSIREYGIIQPLIVSKKGESYELIAGERRLRAAKALGLEKIPIIIRAAEKQEKLEVSLIENIQRENLNPIELALAYRRLIDEFNLTQEEVARRVGKSRPSITNMLRLLNLPEEIQLALIGGKITEGHAKYLIGLDSEAKQMTLFKKILRSNLSVQDANKEARRMGGTKKARIKINYTDKDKEFALREFFGTRVEIKRKGKGGQIIIDFYSDEELGEIVGKVKDWK
jgi:ParB family chromosome partitioning protein